MYYNIFIFYLEILKRNKMMPFVNFRKKKLKLIVLLEIEDIACKKLKKNKKIITLRKYKKKKKKKKKKPKKFFGKKRKDVHFFGFLKKKKLNYTESKVKGIKK